MLPKQTFKQYNMKLINVLFFLMLTLSVQAQDKTNYTNFNRILEVKGTDYVIATASQHGKGFNSLGKYLLFINTKNGEHQQVEFPQESYHDHVEQIKIDKLNINLILVCANTVDSDGKGGGFWEVPIQLIVFSIDGKQRTQITDNKFLVQAWAVNNETGRIVITGHYDSNDNGKYDKTDKNEIIIYDLATMKVVSKI